MNENADFSIKENLDWTYWIMHRMYVAYALLYLSQHKYVYSTCIYALIWMKIAPNNDKMFILGWSNP